MTECVRCHNSERIALDYEKCKAVFCVECMKMINVICNDCNKLFCPRCETGKTEECEECTYEICLECIPKHADKCGRSNLF